MTADPIRREAATLLAEFESACDRVRSTYGDYASSLADEYADECEDRLISFIEAHDLQDTEFDPRKDTTS